MTKPTIKQKPTGLPKPKTGPESLPEIPTTPLEAVSKLDANVDKARLCPKCGREGRVVSNRLGVNVHCGPCKIHWPITNSPLRPETPSAVPRGFSKHTLVEPDWNMAFDELPEGN